MRISLNWLADYVKLPAVDELAKRLTMAGLEIEGREALGAGLDKVVVGQIVESSAHPNAEKLSVTRVDVGQGAPLQIVCGAKNYKAGDKVPAALVGAKLPNGVEIKQAALRGVDSFGMLCSAKELGIAEDASGLLILDGSLKPGTPIADALMLRDTAFEVNVTPNRPDALSHLGIAREVHALTGVELKLPDGKVSEGGGAASSKASVKIEAPDRCPRYLARVIEGVKVGPSPQWMQARLRAAGVRPISNIVDVTNYVLLEYGHPLHAFDLDHVTGAQIVVRMANQGEKLTTLDGKERELSTDDLVIADGDRAVALAGVMGGGNSEVSDKTTRILLESAYFNPGSIRRSSRRHGLHTEASHRFERGTDVDGAPLALDRAAKLIAELGGGQVLSGAIDVYPTKLPRRSATLRFLRLADVLGLVVPQEACSRILKALGFNVTDEKRDQLTVEIPMRRVDVEREEDLIEEVARIHGYDQVPSQVPRIASPKPVEPIARAAERRVRAALNAAGLSEVLNYSFVSTKELQLVDPEQKLGKPIALKNPLSAEQAVMRTSLLPGLLQNLARTLNHQSEDVRFYELGRVYRPHVDAKNASQPAVEELRLAGLVFGHRSAPAWSATRENVDFYDAKGAVEGVLQSLGISARFEPAREAGSLHPRASAAVLAGGQRLGTVGELHPRIAEALDLPAGIFVFDLSQEALATAAQLVPHYRGLPKFPSALRDLAVVVDEAVSHEKLESVARKAGGEIVAGVQLFDVYRGQNIPAGRKSLAYAIRYQHPDRTPTDAEVNAAHERIVAALTQEAGAELRA